MRGRLAEGFNVDLRGLLLSESSSNGASNILLPSQSVDAAGAVDNPSPDAAGDIALTSATIEATGSITNPNPVGSGDIALPAPTIAASGTSVAPTLLSADFTLQSAGGGSVASYGLTFARASAGHSVQTGTTTVATGGTIDNNNVPRFGKRLDAHNVGLVLEESRTTNANSTRNTGGTGWSSGAGTYTADAAAGPDGQTLADRHQSASGGFTRYLGPAPSAGTYTCSVWLKEASGGTTFQIAARPNNAAQTTAVGGSAISTWQRYGATVSHTSSTLFFIPTEGRDFSGNGGITAGARDNYVDLAQMELGGFATEVIMSTGTAVTRAGEQLSYPTGSSLRASDGSLRPYYKLRPKGSSSQYANDMRFWYVDANNHAEVVASTGAVKITIGGTAYTTATTASWAANDLVEFWLPAGGGTNATVVKYRVNGGSVTTLSTGSPPTQASITISGALDLLCASTSNQFSAWVELIELYPVGVSPSGF